MKRIPSAWFNLNFEETDTYFELQMREQDERFDVRFEELYLVGDSALDHYKGTYEVTPKTAAQELETKNKVMDDNVHIKSIPFYSVSNTSGGETVYIGSEL